MALQVVVCVLACYGILLFPFFSSRWNLCHKAIINYMRPPADKCFLVPLVHVGNAHVVSLLLFMDQLYFGGLM